MMILFEASILEDNLKNVLILVRQHSGVHPYSQHFRGRQEDLLNPGGRGEPRETSL